MKREGPLIVIAATLGVGSLLSGAAAVTIETLAVFFPPVPRVPLDANSAEIMAAWPRWCLGHSILMLLLSLLLLVMLLWRHTFPHHRLKLRPTGLWLPKVSLVFVLALTAYGVYVMHLAIVAYTLARASQPDLASVAGIGMSFASFSLCWSPAAFLCLAHWWSPAVRAGHCQSCGYDRTGLASKDAKCPECGGLAGGTE